jgi:hypothetical protein
MKNSMKKIILLLFLINFSICHSQIENDSIIDKSKETQSDIEKNKKQKKKKGKKELIFIELDNKNIIHYQNVDFLPISSNCDPKIDRTLLEKCIMEIFHKHIRETFRASLAAQLGLKPGIYEIRPKFIIDDNGEVINIEVNYDNKELRNETLRVINLIPKMEPAIHNGEFANVEFNLSFMFFVE